MIIRLPSRDSGKIGRKVQFHNPLKFSNKKHYWNQGTGNLGFLTSQQIEILNQMKGLQRNNHPYKFHQRQSSFHQLSPSSFKQTFQKKKVNRKKYFGNPFLQNEDLFYEYQSVEPDSRNNFHIKNRSISEVKNSQIKNINDRSFRNLEPLNSQTKVGVNQQQKIFKKTQTRSKTLGVETIQNCSNEFIDYQSFPKTILKDLKLKGNKNLRKSMILQSGNVTLSYSPQKVSVQNQQIDTIKKTQKGWSLKYQSSLGNINQNFEPSNSPDKTVVTPAKSYLQRQKLKRDHSPTFCNSFQYPLRYFRHI